MSYSFENVYDLVEPDSPSPQHILNTITYYRDHHFLIPTDHIYSTSPYFPIVYNMDISELREYARQHSMDIPLEKPTHTYIRYYFDVIRTIIYYIDAAVQTALLQLDYPNITCPSQSDGVPTDPIAQHLHDSPVRLNVYRLVYFTETDGVTHHCYDIVTLASLVDKYLHSPPISYDPALSYQLIYAMSTGQAVEMLDNEKAWWVAYREDFNKHIPFLPDRDYPHRYRNLYHTGPLVDNLERGIKVKETLNKIADMNLIIDLVNDPNHKYTMGDTLLHLVILYTPDTHILSDRITQILGPLVPGSPPDPQRSSGSQEYQTSQEGVDINIRNNAYLTPLMYSINYHSGVTKLLLDYNADPNMTYRDGRTPLMTSASDGNLEIVKLLLLYHADPNIQDKNGETALMNAIKGPEDTRYEIIQLLLRYHAHPNIQNSSGQTALMMAVEYASTEWEIFQLLLEHGANPNIPDKFGNTPLMITAEDELDWAINEMLLRYGADPAMKNTNHQSALDIARLNGNYHLLDYVNSM